jgi:hypothetical protein
MKKTCFSFIVVLIFLLLSGCSSNNDTVKNGTYVMEKQGIEEVLLPHVTISDDDIVFSFDLLSSYLSNGSYSINDDILTMTTDDNKYSYVFQIDGDNLIFQEDESSIVHMTDDKFGVKVTDDSKFHLKDE